MRSTRQQGFRAVVEALGFKAVLTTGWCEQILWTQVACEEEAMCSWRHAQLHSVRSIFPATAALDSHSPLPSRWVHEHRQEAFSVPVSYMFTFGFLNVSCDFRRRSQETSLVVLLQP